MRAHMTEGCGETLLVQNAAGLNHIKFDFDKIHKRSSQAIYQPRTIVRQAIIERAYSLLSLHFLADPSQYFVKLALHSDHLLAHMQNHFSALKIHAHLLDEKIGDANAIDLIGGVKLPSSLRNWTDHALSL
jgi:hypothetical protein